MDESIKLRMEELNMKKLLALLLLFGIVGCASIANLSIDPRNFNLGCGAGNPCQHISHSVELEKKWKFVEIKSNYDEVAYPKAEAINIATGDKFHWGANVGIATCPNNGSAGTHECPDRSVLKYCEKYFGSECVLSKFNDVV